MNGVKSDGDIAAEKPRRTINAGRDGHETRVLVYVGDRRGACSFKRGFLNKWLALDEQTQDLDCDGDLFDDGH